MLMVHYGLTWLAVLGVGLLYADPAWPGLDPEDSRLDVGPLVPLFLKYMYTKYNKITGLKTVSN